MALKTETDHRHLARAIELAVGGRGRVSPNPLVGAVIARGEEIISEGFHTALGAPHAEVEAISAAGDADLAGATLYVSLEPCAHHGRTPPCTDAIRTAGISRVVVGSDDPSEHASGRGLVVDVADDGPVEVDGAVSVRREGHRHWLVVPRDQRVPDVVARLLAQHDVEDLASARAHGSARVPAARGRVPRMTQRLVQDV